MSNPDWFGTLGVLSKPLFNYRWYDGFSVFHVGPDGLIYKHVADKVRSTDVSFEESYLKLPFSFLDNAR